ncbi:Protein vts1 [Gossypium arboreum]|uniref:Protein vts1 n=1 Tax=Gossypium arboreum TaxID=29729 RepID=A0A0B0PFR5_GOSAR|nr:Protein vts1 [Gossypium arboreum]
MKSTSETSQLNLRYNYDANIVKPSLDSGIVRSIDTLSIILQRHERVSQPCETHGHVTRRMSPGVALRIKAVYPAGLTQPRHTGVSTGRVCHTDSHMGV